MEWLTAIIGLSGILLIIHSIPIINSALKILKFKKKFEALPLTPIKSIKDTNKIVKIKGIASTNDTPLFSLFDDTTSIFYKVKIFPNKKISKKIYTDKKSTNFIIKDNSGGKIYIAQDIALSNFGRFIIFHRNINSDMTQYIKYHLISKDWRDKVKNSEAIETYLSNKKEVTLVGYVKKINGKLYLEADKKKEFVIFECLDEAFSLIHLKIFTRTFLIGLSFLLSGCFQLYMIFFVLNNLIK